jgi:hypothetical protein
MTRPQRMLVRRRSGITGAKVLTDMFDPAFLYRCMSARIDADLLLIVPATADLLARPRAVARTICHRARAPGQVPGVRISHATRM